MNDQTNARLKAYVERIERLNDDKAAISEDLKDLYTEVKSAGYDTKIVRKLISIRKRDKADLQEEEALIDVYAAELGMLPLFEKSGE